MRNLKKILAMVLALVMSLSLMATAGASQFPDVDDSNPYKTAIDVLDELKVFQGFEDGTFKPTDTLNRAQAAVLVYRIATGDVDNKYLDNYTYMQQSKFNDLDGYNWAKGYINYCQNAKIVVGTSATTFDPGAPVTGYQLLVMVLRTLGYGAAGEFTDPNGWELETAKIAEREGILKNVVTGDFGAPAARQMVAEILFRGLLHDTVEYSPLTPGGYTNSGETLGKRELGLEDIKGVVMANEFADLEDDDTLAGGKTRLDVDGKIYNLDVKSELTDIGEIRHAYVQNGTKVLTTLENLNDSTVNQPENGKGTKVSDLSKVNGDTQYFLNFEPLESNSSEWRIEFNVEFVDNNDLDVDKEDAKASFIADYGDVTTIMKQVGANEFKFTKSIKAGGEITSADLRIIKGIFDWADGSVESDDEAEANINDGIKGSVYAGANSQSSVNRSRNLAVEMTYNKFKAEYIDGTYTTISSSDNGEWLKTIDNNGDGVADYVFRTDFVMSVIADYNTKKETYFVEFDAASIGTDRKANDSIKKSAIVTEDELKVGDVILYTWIDGKCYVSHPEVDTAAIDKKGIDYKNKTITCGDTTYDWSGIEQEAYHYYHDVSEAQVQVNYNLYKDHFGYVRLFAEANKGFVLLTDGFYATDLKRDHTYKAEIWDNAAEELAEVDVANDNFINTDIDDNTNREEGTWDRLQAFEESYPEHVDGDLANEYVTTIAAYDVDGDGIYSLSDVSDYTGRYAYTKHELDVNSFDKGSLKDKDLKVTSGHEIRVGVSADNDNLNRINATDETLYYYVQYADGDRNRVHPVVVDVDTWTGYSNSSVKLADGDRAYAVTLCYRNTDNDAWLNYETAEIIVIEHEVTGEKNTVFPVTLSQRLIGKNNKIGGNGFVWDSETGKWVLGDFEGKYDDQGAPVVNVRSLVSGDEDLAPVDISDLLHFYEINEDGELELIGGVGKEYANYNIYAGVIVTEIGTVSRSYGEIGLSEGSDDDSAWTLEPKHDFYKSSDNFYTIGYDRKAATEKDEMLHVPGLQNGSLYGDVSSTFSADDLDAVHMNRGDKVIYVTDGDGAVQSIINVTKSEIKVNGVKTFPGVYEGDKHSTEDVYAETWTLMDLWEDIAEKQGDADRPADELIAEAEALLDNENAKADKLTATKDKLQAILDDEEAVKELTGTQVEQIEDLVEALEEAIAAAELKEALEAAPAEIEKMVAAAEKLAGNDAMKLSAIAAAKAAAEAALAELEEDLSDADADDVQAILDELDEALDAALENPEAGAGPIISEDPAMTIAPASDAGAGDDDVDATIKKGTPVTGTQIKKQMKVKTDLGNPAGASEDDRVKSVTFAVVEEEVLSASTPDAGDEDAEGSAYTLYEMTITLTRDAALEAANGLTKDLVINITFGDDGNVDDGDTSVTAVTLTVETTDLTLDSESGKVALPSTVEITTTPENGATAAITWKDSNDQTVTEATAAGNYTGTITVTAEEGFTLEGATYTLNNDSVEANALTVTVTVKAASVG